MNICSEKALQQIPTIFIKYWVLRKCPWEIFFYLTMLFFTLIRMRNWLLIKNRVLVNHIWIFSRCHWLQLAHLFVVPKMLVILMHLPLLWPHKYLPQFSPKCHQKLVQMSNNSMLNIFINYQTNPNRFLNKFSTIHIQHNY